MYYHIWKTTQFSQLAIRITNSPTNIQVSWGNSKMVVRFCYFSPVSDDSQILAFARRRVLHCKRLRSFLASVVSNAFTITHVRQMYFILNKKSYQSTRTTLIDDFSNGCKLQKVLFGPIECFFQGPNSINLQYFLSRYILRHPFSQKIAASVPSMTIKNCEICAQRFMFSRSSFETLNFELFE